MPYKNIKDLPENVKSPLPDAAQRLWLRVFNENFYRCRENKGSDGSCEDVARISAWSAVKSRYKKGKDGKWEPKG